MTLIRRICADFLGFCLKIRLNPLNPCHPRSHSTTNTEGVKDKFIAGRINFILQPHSISKKNTPHEWLQSGCCIKLNYYILNVEQALFHPFARHLIHIPRNISHSQSWIHQL